MTQAIDEREARKQYVRRRQKVVFSIIGAIMATELTCMCLGSSLTSASTAGFLQSLTVVIVPFANAALLRRTPERKVLVGTAIVTCGMLLLSGADFTSLNPWPGEMICAERPLHGRRNRTSRRDLHRSGIRHRQPSGLGASRP